MRPNPSDVELGRCEARHKWMSESLELTPSRSLGCLDTCVAVPADGAALPALKLKVQHARVSTRRAVPARGQKIGDVPVDL
jgi:hypothetical protein